jgi:hypothetical protein
MRKIKFFVTAFLLIAGQQSFARQIASAEGVENTASSSNSGNFFFLNGCQKIVNKYFSNQQISNPQVSAPLQAFTAEEASRLDDCLIQYQKARQSPNGGSTSETYQR